MSFCSSALRRGACLRASRKPSNESSPSIIIGLRWKRPSTTVELLRQYWIPFVPTRDLPHPDRDPLKVRLLGEDLVAFRNTTGEFGLLAANCPHRWRI